MRPLLEFWACRCWRSGVVAVLVWAWLATPRNAEAQAEWIVLSWDDCATGASNKAFSCDSNVGAETFVVSCVPSFGFPKLAHIEVRMHVCFADHSLPDWWAVPTASGCRAGALTAAMVSPGVGCTSMLDPAGDVTFSWGEILEPPRDQNGFTFYLDESIGDLTRARDVTVGQHYELARFTLQNTQTVGAGACGGCSIGASIGSDGVLLFSATDGYNLNFGSAASITWQVPTTNCIALTPTRRQTWGQIKALYR